MRVLKFSLLLLFLLKQLIIIEAQLFLFLKKPSNSRFQSESGTVLLCFILVILTSSSLALLVYSIIRLTFVIAFLLWLTGAALEVDGQHGETWSVVKSGVSIGGAIFSLASVAFGIASDLSLTEGKKSSNPCGDSSYPNQGGIAMGQPQVPPQTNQAPVFVH